MIAVIFEVYATGTGKDEYLSIAAELRQLLVGRPGFISVERFQSIADPEKLLSLSFWESEASIAEWRNLLEHRLAQTRGRNALFARYRIRVAQVIRDYTESDRSQAPADAPLGPT